MAKSAVDDWIADAVARRALEFSVQLRGCNQRDVGVPGLDWTVTELAQHVACLPAFWEGQHAQRERFSRPADFATMSDRARAHITETDPARLGALIAREFDDYVSNLAAGDGTRWLYGVETTATTMCGLAVNELVLHGRDLAQVTGARKPSFTRAEANLAVDATMVTLPFFVDDDKAKAQPDGVYHLHFRGGHDYTWTKQGVMLAVERGRPRRATARLNADPAVFMMTSLNRMGQMRATMGGGLIAYGRKPWRFLSLPGIVADGV